MLQPYLITAILSALIFFVPSRSGRIAQWSTRSARLGHLGGLTLMTAITVLLAVCILKASPLAFALLQMAGALYLMHIACSGMLTTRQRKCLPSPRFYVSAVTAAFDAASGFAFTSSVLPNIITSESAAWPQMPCAGLIHLAVSSLLLSMTATLKGPIYSALSTRRHRPLLCTTLLFAAFSMAVRDLFHLY